MNQFVAYDAAPMAASKDPTNDATQRGAEQVLRELIATGISGVNEQNGGRYLSTIARHLGVDRTTVTRWVQGRTTASVDHCRALAEAYPEHFDFDHLVELQARSALRQPAATPTLTVGAAVHETAAEVHRSAAEALLADPGPPANRVCMLAAMHLDRQGVDAVSEDPHMDDDSGQQIMAFRAAMAQRAAEGWKIRNVVVTKNLARLQALEYMVDSLDGPDVEIKVYPMAVPLVLAPLIVANRDVFLAYDHRRWERPDAALGLRSASVVRWASDYFNKLFIDAPYIVRDVHGPVPKQFDALRADLMSRPD